MTSNSARLLRTVLIVDAVTCAVMGAALTLGADVIAGLTRLPPGLLLGAGLVLFPIAAVIAAVARPPRPSSGGVGLVVAGNILWVIASVFLPVSGWVAPNALGYAFLAMQALSVAALAMLEHAAARRETPLPAE